MLFSFAYITFCHSGVSQGEGKATASRCSQQRSNASHHHPAALVPGLFVKDALFAKEGCSYAYTGAIGVQTKIIDKIRVIPSPQRKPKKAQIINRN